MAVLTVSEVTVTTRDKINLVSRVGLLRITTGRRVELHYERTMRKYGHGQISGRRWAFAQRLDQPNMSDLFRCRHDISG